MSCRSEPTAVLPKMPESTITSPEDSEASLSLTRSRRSRRAVKSALVVSSPVVLEDLTPVVSGLLVLEDPTPVVSGLVVLEDLTPVVSSPLVLEDLTPVVSSLGVLEDPTPVVSSLVVLEDPTPVVLEDPTLVISSTVVLEDLMWGGPEIATETALVMEWLESTPEPASVQEHIDSTPELAPVREPSESTPELAPVQEHIDSTPELAPVREPLESTPEPAPVQESPEPTQVFESPGAAVSASAPLWVVAPTPELSVCTVTAKETVVLSACPFLVKETIAELSVRPVEAVIKLFVLLFAVMMVSFGGLLVVLVPLRWLAASPLLPALPAPPWPPALPPFLIHLPLHGPGPPSLPLIHLHSTSHLKLLDFLWSVWKPLFRGRVMSQSVVGVPSLATRGHSLWVIVCSELRFPSPFALIIG